MTFPQFLAKWTNPSGQRIDYDHAYAYQCVDLIRQYCYEVFGLGNAAGGVEYAIDYWTMTPPGMLGKFSRIPTTTVQAGDIVMINGSRRATSHIMIATGNQSVSEFEGMEQNGSTGNGSGIGGDAIRTRYVAKSRIAGVLRPIVVAAAPVIPMITLAQLSDLYSSLLHRVPDASGVQHYVGHYTYDFVRNDMLNSAEYKQAQANLAAIAAAQALAAAAAAAQAAAKPTPAPAGAISIPTSTEKYPIKTTLPIYTSQTDAMNKTTPTGEKILAGATWYIFCEKGGVYNLTQTPGFSQGIWINPDENKVPPSTPPPAPAPTPEPIPAPTKPVETEATIRASFIPIMPDGSPIDCLALDNILAIDAFGKGAPIRISKERDLKVYGTFKATDHFYALVKIKGPSSVQRNYMYGVIIASRDNFDPYLDDIYKLSDHIQRGWESFFDKSIKTIEGIYKATKSKLKQK